MVLFTFIILCFAYLIRIFERPYYTALYLEKGIDRDDFDSYFNAIWLVVITLTTVGYGDMYAVTPIGRGITILIAAGGAFLITLMVATLSKSIQLTDIE